MEFLSFLIHLKNHLNQVDKQRAHDLFIPLLDIFLLKKIKNIRTL